jgi:hypothetical protein
MRRRSLKIPTPIALSPPLAPGHYTIDETDGQQAKARLAQLRKAGRIAYIRPDRPHRIEVID